MDEGYQPNDVMVNARGQWSTMDNEDKSHGHGESAMTGSNSELSAVLANLVYPEEPGPRYPLDFPRRTALAHFTVRVPVSITTSGYAAITIAPYSEFICRTYTGTYNPGPLVGGTPVNIDNPLVNATGAQPMRSCSTVIKVIPIVTDDKNGYI